jgi:Domain of unknown function (DUF4349)
MRGTRRAGWAAAAILALCGLAGAVSGCAGSSASEGPSGGGQTAAHRAIAGALAPAGVAAGGSAGAPRDVARTLATVPPAVIETATLDLRVAHGRFRPAMDAAALLATRLGGIVSRQSSSGTRVHTGMLVLRVPAARFTRARLALERLGRATHEAVSGRDVTQQFVDLGARLGNLRSQEAALRRLMRRAQTVSDTIRVQNVLQGVELQAEQTQGELNYLHNRAALSTITVDLTEAGARPAPPAHAGAIWKAGVRSLHAATAVVTAVIVGAGIVVPVAVLVLLAVLLGRLAAPWAAPLAARGRRLKG